MSNDPESHSVLPSGNQVIPDHFTSRIINQLFSWCRLSCFICWDFPICLLLLYFQSISVCLFTNPHPWLMYLFQTAGPASYCCIALPDMNPPHPLILPLIFLFLLSSLTRCCFINPSVYKTYQYSFFFFFFIKRFLFIAFSILSLSLISELRQEDFVRFQNLFLLFQRIKIAIRISTLVSSS